MNTSTFLITWFRSYLLDARGFDLLKLGIFGVLPALVAIPAEAEPATA
jgi:ACS family D-galactonate transporter-like MFS transporter